MNEKLEVLRNNMMTQMKEFDREREFGNLAAIRDNYPKMVISRDRIPLSDNGIIHRNIIDFLLKGE